MLPILNRPILEYVIENMKKLGVEVVYMIVGHKKDVIKEYFGSGEDWNVEIEYIEQKNPEGIAHAISLGEKYISDPFLVTLGDDLTIAKSLDNIAETFWKNDAWAVEGIVPENDVEALKRTCCVSLENGGRIKEIIEKPSDPISRLRGIGIYLFHPVAFEFIRKTPISPKRNEKEITDTIQLIAREGRAYGALIEGVNLNINTLMDLLRATKILLKHGDYYESRVSAWL
jgi:dTDP-glucose pyrophosphorylase